MADPVNQQANATANPQQQPSVADVTKAVMEIYRGAKGRFIRNPSSISTIKPILQSTTPMLIDSIEKLNLVIKDLSASISVLNSSISQVGNKPSHPKDEEKKESKFAKNFKSAYKFLNYSLPTSGREIGGVLLSGILSAAWSGTKTASTSIVDLVKKPVVLPVLIGISKTLGSMYKIMDSQSKKDVLADIENKRESVVGKGKESPLVASMKAFRQELANKILKPLSALSVPTGTVSSIIKAAIGSTIGTFAGNYLNRKYVKKTFKSGSKMLKSVGKKSKKFLKNTGRDASRAYKKFSKKTKKFSKQATKFAGKTTKKTKKFVRGASKNLVSKGKKASKFLRKGFKAGKKIVTKGITSLIGMVAGIIPTLGGMVAGIVPAFLSILPTLLPIAGIVAGLAVIASELAYATQLIKDTNKLKEDTKKEYQRQLEQATEYRNKIMNDPSLDPDAKERKLKEAEVLELRSKADLLKTKGTGWVWDDKDMLGESKELTKQADRKSRGISMGKSLMKSKGDGLGGFSTAITVSQFAAQISAAKSQTNTNIAIQKLIENQNKRLDKMTSSPTVNVNTVPITNNNISPSTTQIMSPISRRDTDADLMRESRR